MSYWKEMEVQKNFEDWKGQWDGSIFCGCDHGCNQWNKEQRCRASILFRLLTNPNRSTSLEKVTRMPLERINKIWYWLARRDNDALNKKIKAEEKRLGEEVAERVGWDVLNDAYLKANKITKDAAVLLNMNWTEYHLAHYYGNPERKKRNEQNEKG